MATAVLVNRFPKTEVHLILVKAAHIEQIYRDDT